MLTTNAGICMVMQKKFREFCKVCMSRTLYKCLLYFISQHIFNPCLSYATALHGKPLSLVTVTKVLLAHKLVAHE